MVARRSIYPARSSACLPELAIEDEPMEDLLAHSITYRIAVRPRAGREVFTLQSLPAADKTCSAVASRAAGFSLDVDVAARAGERQKLERLCRTISCPAVSEARLSLTHRAAWCATN